MIGTITLNPCIDRTCSLKGLSIGSMNRIISDRRDVSGKGIDVSLALSSLSVDVKTGGFIYKDNKEFFLSSLVKMGINVEGVEVDGRLRENIKLWDIDSGITTEVNQAGSYVPPEKWLEFKDFFSAFIDSLELVVISGSVPKGIDERAYKELIEIASSKAVPVFLDAEGSLLEEGLKAKPLLIKPNLYEFERSFGKIDKDKASIARQCKAIINKTGIEYICLTMGKEGAFLATKDRGYFSLPLDVDVKCTQGAGDGVVAGLAKAYSEKKGVKEMLRFGLAAAAATISTEGTQMCNLDSFESLLPRVMIEEVE